MFTFTPNLPNYTLGKSTGLLPFELFTHVKKGHLHPLDKNGEPILSPDIKDKIRRLEGLQTELRILPLAYGALQTGFVMPFRCSFSYNDMEAEKQKLDERKESLQNEYKDLKQELDAIKDKYSWVDYELPINPKQRQQVFDLLSNATYLIKDIAVAHASLGENIPTGCDLKTDQVNIASEIKNEESAQCMEQQLDTKARPSDLQADNKDTDFENFIQNLQVSFSSDTSIVLRQKGKESHEYSRQEIGFKANAKPWTLLMEILQSSSHEYYVGTYSKDKLPEKNRDYYKNIGNMKEFSKKFVFFLNETYDVQIPENFNVFENKHMTGEDRPGTYVPKFRIVSPGVNLEELSDDELMETINNLAEQLEREINKKVKDSICKQLIPYANLASSKGLINLQQFSSLVMPDDQNPSEDDAMAHIDRRQIL